MAQQFLLAPYIFSISIAAAAASSPIEWLMCENIRTSNRTYILNIHKLEHFMCI